MNHDKRIVRLESALERFVETTFASLFRKPVSAHDLAVALARGMTIHARPSNDGDSRAFAPDRYEIYLNPQVCASFQHNAEAMLAELSHQMIGLAAQSGYRLISTPHLVLAPDDSLGSSNLIVLASHTMVNTSTAMMAPIAMPQTGILRRQQLIVGERAIALTQPVINIGRSDDNTIVVDDPFMSRHHLQLRMRNGSYLLFDADSKSGTLVNDVAVREHHLQSGDIISVGDTHMIYLIEDVPGRTSPGTTAMMDAIS